MSFSAKAILEFFKLFYLNFNLEQYVRKNYTSIPRIFSILKKFSFKISPRTLKNVYYFESYLKFKGRFYTSAGKSGLFFENELQRIY